MNLKSLNVENLPKIFNKILLKGIVVESLTYKLDYLNKQIEELFSKYKTQDIPDKSKVNDWFNSLPIESLNDSLREEYNLSMNKFNLISLKERFNLRKEYSSLCKDVDKCETELKIAKIEYLQADIQTYLH